MKPINENKLLIGKKVHLSSPCLKCMDEFLAKTYASKDFHALWSNPPLTQDEYKAYLNRINSDNQWGFFIRLNTTDEIIGVINVYNIIRGAFQSGYLGYYCFKGYEKQGLMREGMKLLTSYAFNTMKLHRLEANIQPDNISSLLLIMGCGFVKEGYSKRYLNINNQWQDHVRYASTVEVYKKFIEDTKHAATIRILKKNDIESLTSSFKDAGLNKTATLFNQYYTEQSKEERIVWVAILNGLVVGYVTLVWQSQYQPFASKQIPEIKDLNVVPKYRRKGIGTALLNRAETTAFDRSTAVGIGVGLYSDYGAAQNMYLSLGYTPDGNGITYDYQVIKPGNSVCVDDDLCLWLVKQLKKRETNDG